MSLLQDVEHRKPSLLIAKINNHLLKSSPQVPYCRILNDTPIFFNISKGTKSRTRVISEYKECAYVFTVYYTTNKVVLTGLQPCSKVSHHNTYSFFYQRFYVQLFYNKYVLKSVFNLGKGYDNLSI